jgi:hypothetical protein
MKLHDLRAALLCAALAAATQCVEALEPPKSDAVVYRNQSFEGAEHKLNFSPPQVATVYLLAGHDNLIDPRHTLSYFWPLKREYVFDWDGLNLEVAGELEIRRNGALQARLVRVDTAVAYPDGIEGGRSALLTGAAALLAKERYDQAAAVFNRRLVEASRAQAAYEAALRQYLRDCARGAVAALPPKPAPPPAGPRNYVAELGRGFVLNLTPGRYQMRVVERGKVVEGSQRDIVVFTPLRGDAIAWDVVPEERWTRRLTSEAPGADIYVAPGITAYLLPKAGELFDAERMVRLRDPQADTPAGETVWVERAALPGGTLLAHATGLPPQQLAWRGFSVRQAAGGAVGYTIAPTPTGAGKPDLTAFALTVPAGAAGATYELLLQDGGGTVRVGSRRLLRVVDGGHAGLLWLLSLLPALTGAALLLWRRRGGAR